MRTRKVWAQKAGNRNRVNGPIVTLAVLRCNRHGDDMGSVGAAFATEGANNKLGDFRRIPVQMSGADKLLNGRVEPFDFQTACAFRTEELIQGQSRVQAQRNRGKESTKRSISTVPPASLQSAKSSVSVPESAPRKVASRASLT